jgi:hypothetical protein
VGTKPSAAWRRAYCAASLAAAAAHDREDVALAWTAAARLGPEQLDAAWAAAMTDAALARLGAMRPAQQIMVLRAWANLQHAPPEPVLDAFAAAVRWAAQAAQAARRGRHQRTAAQPAAHPLLTSCSPCSPRAPGRSEAEQLDEEQLLRLQFSLRRLHKSAAWVRSRIRELKERRDAAAAAAAAEERAATRPITLADLVTQLQVRCAGGRCVLGAGVLGAARTGQAAHRCWPLHARTCRHAPSAPPPPSTTTNHTPLHPPPHPSTPPPHTHTPKDCADKDEVVAELLGRYQARLAQLAPGELVELLAALAAGDAR